MNKILITGHKGLVGRACADLFWKSGWEVVGLDSNERAKFFNTEKQKDQEAITNIEADIRDEGAMNILFQYGTFDAIIHAAGQPSHDYATDHAIEDFDINARGTLILLEATRKYCPDATFVFVSTDKVYGENMAGRIYNNIKTPTRLLNRVPYNESLGLDFAGNRSLFGCSKAAADLYVQEYGHRFGIETACFRPGCITGRNHQGAEQHGFLAYLVKCIREGKTYKIFGHEGKQVRDQIHADDLASAFKHFIDKPRVAEVYNIGGGPARSVSIIEAGEMISKKLKKPFLFEHHPARVGDRSWDVHNVAKFTKHYPRWRYEYSLKDIINDLCL